jgi:hypothetical protein
MQQHNLPRQQINEDGGYVIDRVPRLANGGPVPQSHLDPGFVSNPDGSKRFIEMRSPTPGNPADELRHGKLVALQRFAHDKWRLQRLLSAYDHEMQCIIDSLRNTNGEKVGREAESLRDSILQRSA